MRVFSFILLLALFPTVFAGASGSGLPKLPVAPPATAYDATAVDSAMANLGALEQYVVQTQATLAEVRASRPELVSGLNLRESSTPAAAEDGPLGISSLIWGLIGGLLGSCLLGGVAVLVVYLVTDDRQEAKQALLGCILGSLITGAISFLLRAAGYVNF